MTRFATLLFLPLLLVLAAPASAQSFGGAVGIASDSEIIVGKTAQSPTGGELYVYRRQDNGSWTEHTRLRDAGNEGVDDRFGRAFSISGDRLIVGATTHAGNLGGVFLFERNASGEWTQTAQLSASDGQAEDYLGRAVGLSGDFAFATAAGKNDDAGALYVFHRQADGAWAEHQILTAEDAAPESLMGLAMAVHGDHAFVGAPFADSLAGAVYVFGRQADDTWQQIQKLEGPAETQFGSAISAAEGRLLVGAPRFEDNVGTAYAFELGDDGQWTQTAQLLPFDGDQGRFGSDVVLAGDRVYVTSPGAAGFRGGVYIFDRNADGSWAGAEKMVPERADPNDFYASALAAHGDLLVMGNSNEDYGAGNALVFTRAADGYAERAMLYDDIEENYASITGEQVPCADDEAAGFGCANIDMVSFLSIRDIGGGRGVRVNDVWGWTDPETGKEYALVGRVDGTSFVDLSDPYNPVFVGDLPKTEGSPGSGWRDIKVYQDHAFIVADAAGNHGVQVFDLRRLRDVAPGAMPARFDVDAHYDGIASAHNIVINEDTGYAFTVGNGGGGETCGGGLHMIDIREPDQPTFAGCFAHEGTGRASTGYTHDAQCVLYSGPDVEHQGQEICFSSNETALSIADVTDKENPKALAQAAYPNVAYTHQGWLTEDHRYFYINDEGDEIQGLVDGTRTLIWDVADLDDPILVREFVSDNKSSDHNLYIRDNLMYQSNYVSGLRVFDITDPANPVEVAHFDTVPHGDDAPGFDGSWSNYPYFDSGVIVVTSMREGVFFVKKKGVDL